jgi:spoIIIJ-associated protein
MAVDEQVLEVRGHNVDEAIRLGLEQLRVNREDVDIEVVDEGSGGFLGIGGRDALVRLTLRQPPVLDQSDSEPGTINAAQEMSAISEEPAAIEPAREEPVIEEDSAGDTEEIDVALEIISTLLEKMQIEATTSLRQTEPDDITGNRLWIVDIHGQDMGVLIGPRGETLNAFQYISRLMTSHVIHRRTTFIIDVEGYRVRREKALARLADRMAAKVIGRGHALSLEPMPPNERRIIHVTLRDNKNVYTESFGEGKRRQVRIYPKSEE